MDEDTKIDGIGVSVMKHLISYKGEEDGILRIRVNSIGCMGKKMIREGMGRL